MAVAELEVRITGNTADLSGALNKAQGSLKGFGKSMSSAGKSMTLGLTLPIVAFGKKAVDAFNEAQSVMAQTEAVIKSTGGAAGLTATQVAGLAEKFSQLTAYEDEAIQGAQNLLLTFTQVGKDVFPTATQAILDMSQAMGQDLKSTTIQVGKALNDPIKGLTALSRVGVNFTKDQKEMIKGMVESGDVMGAQKVILAELAKEFGGVAAAFAKTDAGKQAQAMNNMGNAMERLGAALSPVVTDVLNKLADGATRIAGAFSSMSPAVQEAILVIGGIVAVAGPVLVVIGSIISAIGTIGSAIGAVVGFIAPALAAVAAAFAALAAAVGVSVGAFIAIIVAIGLAVAGLATLLGTHWDSIVSATSAAWSAVTNAVSSAASAIAGAASAAFNAVKSAAVNGMNAMKSAVSSGVSAVLSFFSELPGKIVSALSGLASALYNAGKNAIQGFINGIKSMAGAALSAVGGVISGAISLASKLLDEKSPSKVFRDIGMNTMRGYAEGIKAGHKGVAAAFAGTPGMSSSSQAKMSAPAMSNSGGAASSGGGIVINLNVEGSVVTERDLLATLRQGLIQGARRGDIPLEFTG